MSGLYKNKYRIDSARLKNWDYRWNAAYFITICTHDKVCFFGDIENGEMKLSDVGVIADLIWFEIKNRSKHIELGEYVVMPNHIHGILILNNPDSVFNDDTMDSSDSSNSVDTFRRNDRTTENDRTTPNGRNDRHIRNDQNK